MIGCLVAVACRPLLWVLEKLFPPQPRMIGVFEPGPGAQVLNDGTVLVRPDYEFMVFDKGAWSPFNDDGGLRTELYDEGWHIVGAMKED